MPGTRLRACRARKLLQKKEEQKAADKAAGIDLPSDYSDDESLVKCNWFCMTCLSLVINLPSSTCHLAWITWYIILFLVAAARKQSFSSA